MQLKTRIYRKIFIQFIWRTSCDLNTRKSVYSKVMFLIASDWSSLIIVTNVFFAFGS